jgi:hypothetical protein
MAHLDPGAPGLPVSDKVLRDLAKNAAKILPNFAEKEPATGVKLLFDGVGTWLMS